MKVYYVDASGKLRELVSSDGGQTYLSGLLDSQIDAHPTVAGSLTANISAGADDPSVFFFDQSDPEHVTEAHFNPDPQVRKWSTRVLL